MKKGMFLFLLMFVILCLPNSVFAEVVRVENTDIYSSDDEYYKVDNGVLTTTGANSTDYNIRLDKENNKLYINNFTSTNNLYTDIDNFNIILEGTNSIVTNEFNGIESSKNIILDGTGKISIISDGNGIRSEQKVTINNGDYTIKGNNYNGIEAYQIEINGGLVNTSGGYSGIHTQPNHLIEQDDSFFKVNGGNLYTKAGKGDAINSHNTDYKDCIIIIDKEGITKAYIYGTATLLSDLSLSTNLVIPKNSVLNIPKDISLELSNKDLLTIEGIVNLQGKFKVGDKQFYNINIKKSSNGIVNSNTDIALEGEEVNLTVTPNSKYELSSLKYYDSSNKEVVITNNKFIMPNSDIIISAEFGLINDIDIKNPDTGDNIIITFILFGITLVGIIVSLIYICKAFKKKI